MTRLLILVVAVVACGSGEPAKVERAANEDAIVHAIRADVVPADAVPADAVPVTAAAPKRSNVVASWSSEATAQGSPACITGGNDRFIQYSDLDEKGALRFCLWWNLRKRDGQDVGCWRVDLATGVYTGETGVWFSTPQPPRVGLGGGAPGAPPSSPAVAVKARWHDTGLEVCRDTACRSVPLAKPTDELADREVAFDREGRIAVVTVGRSPGKAKATVFATVDVTTGKQIATLAIADRHEGAEVMGVVGSSLVVTDCDVRSSTCAWALHDVRTGAQIAAVGGATPLGAGGSAAAIDETSFAAVAGTRLVVQDARTGKVSATIGLPRAPNLRADYVVFRVADGLVLPAPDGRIVLVDPVAGRITRTIIPPKCRR